MILKKPEISRSSVYHNFGKRSNDGRLKRLWEQGTERIRILSDLSELNPDGTHIMAKKVGNLLNVKDAKKLRQAIHCIVFAMINL
jgi:hypothetical protein